MKKLRLALLATFALFGLGSAFAQPLVFVFYPNESTPEFAEARSALVKVMADVLGREVREQLTTDYAIAIEALANNNAAFSWLGGEGYIQAHDKQPAVIPLVVNTDETGDLDNAKYFSLIGVLNENADQYKVNGEFALSTLKQKRFSFVSSSSTSGFRVPSSVISAEFGVDAEDLLIGGPDEVFSEVQYGGSHQGALFNVLTGRSDAAAFCTSCVDVYVEFPEGSYGDPRAGDVITIREGADEPFHQHPGVEVVFVATVPVLNAPFVVNTNLVSLEEVAKLQEYLIGEEIRSNPWIFGPEGAPTLFREGQRFAVVEDGWYDPIRRLAGTLE